MTSSSTLPPPLSDAPSVDTLQRLLVGLHEPVERGVPSPPAAAGPPGPPGPPSRAQVLDLHVFAPPSLSWSAGLHRRVLGTATVVGIALATAAIAAAGLLATGVFP